MNSRYAPYRSKNSFLKYFVGELLKIHYAGSSSKIDFFFQNSPRECSSSSNDFLKKKIHQEIYQIFFFGMSSNDTSRDSSKNSSTDSSRNSYENSQRHSRIPLGTPPTISPKNASFLSRNSFKDFFTDISQGICLPPQNNIRHFSNTFYKELH